MSAPFNGSLIGSWLITATSETDLPKDTPSVHHFTADGRFHLEVNGPDLKFLARPLQYHFAGGKLTLVFPDGRERSLELFNEDDGKIRATHHDGHTWAMVRLTGQEPFTLASVNAEGNLQLKRD